MSGLPDELWDGNGGTLDARKASQRDLLVSLHVKVDRLVSDVADHDVRLRTVESGQKVASALSKNQMLWLMAAASVAAAVIGSLVYVALSGAH